MPATAILTPLEQGHAPFEECSATVQAEIDPQERSRTLRAERIRELRSRIKEMEPGGIGERVLPTQPDIGALLPGGGLQQGAAYSVDRSAMLLQTLLATPSRNGTWCAIVGVPEFGAEAARTAGIDLERLVLIPRPGEQWLPVTSALADVIGLVVVNLPRRAPEALVSTLHARLRERATTLLVLGNWPHSEAVISLSDSAWMGIGNGHGYLASREATVTVTHRSTGRPRSTRLRWPEGAGGPRSVPSPSLQTQSSNATSADTPLPLEVMTG